MKRLIFFFLFSFVSDIGALEACKQAKADLDKYLIQLPRGCKSTKDCSVRYIRADSCAAPVVIKKSYDAGKDRKLLKLQAPVQNNCEVEFSNRAVCDPQHVTPKCNKGQCVDSNHPDGPAQEHLGS